MLGVRKHKPMRSTCHWQGLCLTPEGLPPKAALKYEFTQEPSDVLSP